MVRRVSFTFLRASVANCRTQAAHLSREPAATRHQLSGQAADSRTIAIELDAISHVVDVLFIETTRCAVIALGSAIMTSLDARAVSFMCHGNLTRVEVETDARSVPDRHDPHAYWRVKDRPVGTMRVSEQREHECPHLWQHASRMSARVVGLGTSARALYQ